MSTPNILMTRIDNRLIHGQVGVTWTTTLNANLIIVADDDVAEDNLQQQLMTVTANSSGAEIRFFSLEKTIGIIPQAGDWQRIFIVVRTPHSARKLVEGGVPLKQVNVGNMHFSNGKIALSKKVYVDNQDKEDLQYLKDNGVDVFLQDVPTSSKENF